MAASDPAGLKAVAIVLATSGRKEVVIEVASEVRMLRLVAVSFADDSGVAA